MDSIILPYQIISYYTCSHLNTQTHTHLPTHIHTQHIKVLGVRACKTNGKLCFLNSRYTLKPIKLHPPLKMLSIPDCSRFEREGDEHLLHQFTEH